MLVPGHTGDAGEGRGHLGEGHLLVGGTGNGSRGGSGVVDGGSTVGVLVHLLGETPGLHPAEVSLGEHLHTGRVDGPEVAPPVAGTPALDEAVVDGEVVAHGIPPGAGGGLVVRVAQQDVVVDVMQQHLAGGVGHHGAGDHLDVGCLRLACLAPAAIFSLLLHALSPLLLGGTPLRLGDSGTLGGWSSDGRDGWRPLEIAQDGGGRAAHAVEAAGGAQVAVG